MRFESLEIDDPNATVTSFRFPATGLAIAPTSNDPRGAALSRVLADVLYADSAASTVPSWALLHVRMDSGETLALTRDFARRTLQITDAAGIDRTDMLLGPSPRRAPGEALLGLSRNEFEHLALVSLDDVRAIEGDTTLARLLAQGRDAARAPLAPAAAPLSSPFDSADTLHVAAAFAASSAISSPAASSGAAFSIDEVRGRKRELDELTRTLEGKESELRLRSASIEELRAEIDRIGALSGAEPKDASKLGELLEVLKLGAERKEQLRRDELKSKRDLSERGLSHERILRLQQLFEATDAAEEQFLEEYRQSDTLHRGNQALVKSESRFDETQLGTITKERETSSRHAVWPFALAVFWVIASITMRLFSIPAIFPLATLFLTVASVALGGHLYWRARGLREAERVQLQKSLERKRAQLAELEKEQRYASGRLALLADARKLGGPRELLERYEEWKATRGELAATRAFEARRAEIESEMTAVREKLGSFAPVTTTNSSSFGTVAEWETLHREYVRHFEAQNELGEAQQARGRVEEELAALETERAALRESIEDVLQNAGLDPSRDLDESIERLAMREWTGSIDGRSDETTRAAKTFAPSTPPARLEPEFGMPAAEPELDGAPWQAAVSARAEALVRRILPHARDLEVDRRFALSLRLDARGPRLEGAALANALCAATLDQAALAVRLAVIEALAENGERIPLVLDDPLVRADDDRYDRALRLLAEDASAKTQIVLVTAHEVRTKWFLHRHPELRSRIGTLDPAPPAAIPAIAASAQAAPPASPAK